MKCIFADSQDFIDPTYDFETDSHRQGHQRYWNDQYPHEHLDHAPYDGILVSRAIVGDHLFSGKYTESQAMRFRRDGARAFLRYPESRYPGSLMVGDCGAFQYHRMETPPYSPQDMLEFYEDGLFTHGCSVDHIIFDFDSIYDVGMLPAPVEAAARQQLTLSNASEFLKQAQPMRSYFEPIGVVQGWSPGSMADAAKQLVAMGYKYIAIGGLVPLGMKATHLAIQAVRDAIPAHIKVHALGFAKANHLHEFVRYNLASFDTTSPLIRAFKDAKDNFWQLSGDGIQFYSAIRIPQAHGNNKLIQKIQSGPLLSENVVKKEQAALKALRAYAVRSVDLGEALGCVLDYTRMVFEDDRKSKESNERDVDRLAVRYEQTLSARPWEGCGCRVCRDVGIEAVIFRGRNRNIRRGFHNLQVFNSYLASVNCAALDMAA